MTSLDIEEYMRTHCWCCDGPLDKKGFCERTGASGPYCSCPSVDWRRRALEAEKRYADYMMTVGYRG